MKQSCPKCGHQKFQFAEIDIVNSEFPFITVQCIHCGYPIGVTNSSNVIETLYKYKEEIKTKLTDIEKEINDQKENH